jgi:hypothetical protein
VLIQPRQEFVCSHGQLREIRLLADFAPCIIGNPAGKTCSGLRDGGAGIVDSIVQFKFRCARSQGITDACATAAHAGFCGDGNQVGLRAQLKQQRVFALRSPQGDPGIRACTADFHRTHGPVRIGLRLQGQGRIAACIALGPGRKRLAHANAAHGHLVIGQRESVAATDRHTLHTECQHGIGQLICTTDLLDGCLDPGIPGRKQCRPLDGQCRGLLQAERLRAARGFCTRQILPKAGSQSQRARCTRAHGCDGE